MLRCPVSHFELSGSETLYTCPGCGAEYPVRENIVDLLPDSSKGIKAEERERERERDEYFFPEEGFDRLFQAEDRNFWFRARNKIIYTFFRRFVSERDTILEIGCGTGYVSTFLKAKGYSPDCGDLFKSALMYCRKRNAGRQYYCYNLYDRIFQNEYDVVCAFDVLEHLDDDRLVFENIRESLNDQGRLILTVPACQRFWSSVDDHAGHKRRYEPAELREKLEEAGFTVERMSFFMFTLLPLYIISRLRVRRSDEKAGTEENDALSGTINYELNPPRALNLLLYYILFVEIALLPYINMPLGSSLICVATKKD